MQRIVAYLTWMHLYYVQGPKNHLTSINCKETTDYGNYAITINTCMYNIYELIIA